ncbi:APB-1 protein [Gorgonomyces haynaldii]|nr:APB-1 protein [Gorgonomyces haynaldii]
MSDSKFFTRGKTHELRHELNSEKHDKISARKNALKKVVANISMGNDMSSLFPDVLNCISIPVLEIKKMVYLYIVTYAKNNPELAGKAVSHLAQDAVDPNPLIRALAIRTMSNIPVDRAMEAVCEPLRKALGDKDPYVCKTATMAVAKLYAFSPDLVMREGFLEHLKQYLNHENPMVVANTVACLIEIASKSNQFEFALDVPTANKLLTVLQESSDWSQTFILESLMTVEADEESAEVLCERITPLLQHGNSAVGLTAIRVIIYLSQYINKKSSIDALLKKIGPCLVTLLQSQAEIQYVALRNIQLILQRHKDFLRQDFKVFYCKYNDPLYVKLPKLEILFKLTDQDNIGVILPELKEYASEVDVEFVSRAVRCIGRCAIKVESHADQCVETLVELIQTKVSYVVQEAIVVLKDIFRKYPSRYENIITIICENLDGLELPEARASLIWIVGQYAERIENANELLEQFIDTFEEEATVVQLSLLTAVVKLFIKRPSMGQDLVPKILKLSTEESDNPDVRDRGFIYWRLLSTDPVATKSIVLNEKPSITTESDDMDNAMLSRLLFNVSTLASVTHKPPLMPLSLSTRLLGLYEDFLKRYGAPPAVVQQEKRFINANDNPYAEEAYTVQKMDLLSLEPSPVTQQYAPGGIPLDLFASPVSIQNTVPNDIMDIFGAPASPPKSYSQPDPRVSPLPGQVSLGSQNSYPTKSQSQSSYPVSSANGYPPNSTSGYPASNANGFPIVPQAAGQRTPALTSTHNPFTQPQIPVQQKPIQPLDLTSGKNPVLDPFAKTSLGEVPAGFSGSQDVLQISLGGFIPPKQVWLQANQGRGLEIQGTFARRSGQMFMDLHFFNRAMEPLFDFAILFNKNTFGLAAGVLDRSIKVFPNQSLEISLPLKLQGLGQPTTPINNVQVAFKTNSGVSYFQTLVPLHVFFVDGFQIQPREWLQMWKDTIPSTNETITTLNTPLGPPDIKSRLANNNIFFVAERTVNGQMLYYGAAKLEEGSIVLLEINFGPTISLATKTFAMHLSPLFHEAIAAIVQ